MLRHILRVNSFFFNLVGKTMGRLVHRSVPVHFISKLLPVPKRKKIETNCIFRLSRSGIMALKEKVEITITVSRLKKTFPRSTIKRNIKEKHVGSQLPFS